MIDHLTHWPEHPLFLAALAAMTIWVAMYPVRISSERSVPYGFAFMTIACWYMMGPRALLLVVPAAAVAAALPYRMVYIRRLTMPLRFVREERDEWRERAGGILRDGNVVAAVGVACAHATYLGAGEGTYPVPLFGWRQVLIGGCVGLLMGGVMVLTNEVMVRRFRAPEPEPPDIHEADEWLLTSDLSIYWLIIIVSSPLHVTIQFCYLYAADWVAFLFILSMTYSNTVYNIWSDRRERLRNTLRDLESRSRLATIGEVTARIVHQTRHQLGLIGVGAVQLEKLVGALPEQEAAALRAEIEKLDDIRRSLQAMLTFDLRASDETTPGRAAGTRGLDDLVRRQVDLLGDKAADRGVELSISISENGCGAGVHHPDTLAEGIFDVIENAVAAARSSVAVAVTREDGRTVIAVRDDGPGMDDTTLARATEPFFTTKPDGTGMGLAIARGAAEKEGGELALANADTGLEVRFILPPSA